MRKTNIISSYVPLNWSYQTLDEWISEFKDVKNVNLKAKVKKQPSEQYVKFLISYSPDMTQAESGDTGYY
jgi:hypothetical protein